MRWVPFIVVAVLLAASCKFERRPTDSDSPVTQVLILPDTVLIDPLGSWQFQVFGRTTVGDSVPVSVQWSASAGEITSSALFIADSSEDDVTITAALSGTSLSGSAIARKRKVVQVLLAPDASTLRPGATQQFTARGVRNSGDTVAISVTYLATGGTISSSGVYTAGMVPGNYRVVATRRALADTAVVSILNVPVASVTVTPGAANLSTGRTVQLTATLRDSAGNVLTGRAIVWTSDAPGVASVSSSGVVTALGVGSATITATSEGKSGTAAITVTIVPVATVTVSPASVSLGIAGTQQLSVVTKDSAGNVLTGRSVTWSSNAVGVATVSAGGLVTAVAVGSATITATSEGKTGSSAITVTGTTPPRVGRYVAVNGTSGGNGTAAQPWDLATALAGAGGRILAGDTVWVRGGRYLGAFTSTLRGSAGLPIIVRAYPGERVIIDGTPSTRETFTIDGTWAVFWGFEITNTILERFNQRPAGIYVRNTSHVKVINFIVHDIGMGTYTESAAEDVEIYGSIYYNNGNQDGTRSNGHGVYIKNQYATPKIAADNIFFNMFGHGLHGYTNAGDGFLQNVVIRGNISFNNGTVSNYPNANILMGGDAPVVNAQITDNMTYFSPGLGFRNLRLGYNTVNNTSATVRRNYIVGGSQTIEANLFGSATFSDNTVHGTGTMVAFAASSGAGWAWANNTEYRDSTAQAWKRGSSAMTFSGWRAATGLGATDVLPGATPTATVVFVRPNQYEPGRAHIAVYNWARQSSVLVALGNVLAVGQRFEIRNVQDLFGAPLVSGTFGGGSVSIPMGGVIPPQPVGGSPVAPVRTGPDFDVFVVIPVP